MVAVLIPKRNVETWILCLTRESVDEVTDYSDRDLNAFTPGKRLRFLSMESAQLYRSGKLHSFFEPGLARNPTYPLRSDS